MHELSIASSVIETVIKEVEKLKLKPVLKVCLRIGSLTDIVPDSLIFGFDSLKPDTILSKAELVIETITIKGYCPDCDIKFEIDNYIFVCPQCESLLIENKEGNELDIAYIEVED